jgi:MoCo/4Fe-4S cofactor protein with predicted Tat translocation signal
MANSKKYWTGLDELHETEAFQESVENEFVQEQSVSEFLGDEKLKESSTGRRDFLKFMGFSVTAATLAACETPVIKSIPYINKPEEITPGVANWYASTYYDGHDFGNVLVKTREGRPIFIKGNKDHGIGGGAINARINASVLGLYDSERLSGPKANGASVSWADFDTEVSAALAASNNTVLVSNSIISPSTQRAIDEFKTKFNARHITYDAISYNGIRKAHNDHFGNDVIPQLDFTKAKVIVSVGADFMGSWMTSNVYHTDYASRRKPEGEWMSQHYQFESCMSLTGSNSDYRYMIKPSQEGATVAALYEAITGGAGSGDVKAAADALKSARGESLVVAGSNDPNIQRVVCAINEALGNYGSTLDIDNGLNLYKGNDAEMAALVKEVEGGSVDGLILYGVNPSYDRPDADAFNAGLANVATSVCLNSYEDETGSQCKFLAPDCHMLESWNDLNAVGDRIDIVQPTISLSKEFNARQAQQTLLALAGNNTDYYSYMRQTYNGAYTVTELKTDQDWNKAVHNGTMTSVVPEVAADAAAVAAVPVVEEAPEAVAEGEAPLPTPAGDVSAAVSAAKNAGKGAGGDFELALYQKVGIGNGNQTSNPWLQELPDPITKLTWDNYVTMAPSDVKERGLNMTIAQRDHASVVTVNAGGRELTLPVFPAPGQAPGTIGIALGYGRGAGNVKIGKSAYQTGEYGDFLTDENGNMMPIGVNVYPVTSTADGCTTYANLSTTVTANGATYPLASTQMHSTVMGRTSIVRETTLAEYKPYQGKERGKAAWNKLHLLAVHEDINKDGVIDESDGHTKDIDLWHEHPIEEVGHRWGMAIDLNSCTGCSACVTACHIENNVPVVGKDEVRRHRDMHWMRIDRFFASDYPTVEETSEAKDLGTIGAYADMENAAANPDTVHMPMMCQHCNHAPCETVCPVSATTHSAEGLNQMTYNRCIGTRYCANNCPYKVRRFNWFNYSGYKKFQNTNPAYDSMARMVLNPDVTVRSRGVMEKCSLCVQRIQSGKLDAKKNGTPVVDGAVQTACAEACPTNAITFGDINDKSSGVKGLLEDVRTYFALEEVGVQPNIGYLTKVRNKA